MPNYYDTLGVPKNASQDEIKAAFRRLAMEHHPDRGGDPEKFKKINEAYQTLSNTETRAQYDQYGSTFEQMRSQGGARGFEGFRDWATWAEAFKNGGGGGVEFGDLGDLFNGAFGGLGDIFSAFSGGGKSAGRARGKRGRDLEMKVEISLEDVVRGVNREIELEKIGLCSQCGGNGVQPGSKEISCRTCGGRGKVAQTVRSIFGNMQTVVSCSACGGEGKQAETPCNACRGKGVAKVQKRLVVKIPAGISDGETIKLVGQGEEAGKGGRPGDFFINIRVRSHKELEREGNDLFSKIQLDFKTAALGGKIEVAGIDGSVELKIPAGTQSGQIFKLKGEGVPSLHSGSRGDHLVEVSIKVPEKLTRRQKEILEEWE
ncbi:MAG: molecular chaperone DnaJ [bacterium]|nr:molecular chaperone DnaJ [bacterium]